ncbi:MAG: 50S ribosomal protein L23 [Micavibrio aeruginosavorus]|uniref:Large ribosomal subunit protein uL23 n=1 Tax=Micavibrio aeruginosavorus TaxID=349221 RepID=A0A2W4ZMU6_9BACT|nr:MAG: 50S ribosomal protein L23 [Micavibrio aeruginosavorus]
MAAKKKEEAKVAEWMYSIIRTPVVTEKSAGGSEFGQVTFKVPVTARKPDIKAAIEALFKVKVTRVNTLIQKGKTKCFKGVKAFRSDEKKAIVTLEEGQTIDVGTGL